LLRALAGEQKLVAEPAVVHAHAGATQTPAVAQAYTQQRKATLAASVPQSATSVNALVQLRATLDIKRLKQEIECDKTGNKAFSGRVIYGQPMLTPICHAWDISPSPRPPAGAAGLRVRVHDEYERRESIAIAEASQGS
jgi:hypothetical protein